MDRRDFLRLLAGSAALAAVSPRRIEALVSQKEAAKQTKGDRRTLAVVKGADPAASTRKAVELVGGMGAYVSRGDVVFVKPNISWDRTPEQGATTNPAVVAAVVAMALEAGAKRVIVADNACNDARRTYVRSGIKAAAEKAGAEVPFMEERKFVKTAMGGEIITEWPAFRDALDADVIINLPCAKHHGLAGVALGLKNTMGLVGGARNRMHQKLPESIVDLTAFFKPRLTVLDATRLLKANGPQGGSLKDVVVLDTIAAGADPVRMEAYGITLFGKRPEDFRAVTLASSRGLGSPAWNDAGFVEVNLG